VYPYHVKLIRFWEALDDKLRHTIAVNSRTFIITEGIERLR